jgi:syntaxin 8
MQRSGDWLTLYEKTEQELNTLSHDIAEAFQKGSAASQRDKRNLSRKLDKVKEGVNELDSLLARFEANPLEFKIGEGEVSRRRGLMSELKNLLISVEDTSNNSKNKRELFSNRRGAPAREEGEDTKAMKNEELHGHVQATMAKQDEQLGAVLEGVTKLKVMSNDIGAELDLHHHLLGDLDTAVTNTDNKIQNNTKRIEIVQDEEGGGCCGLIVIALLVVLILFLATSNAACHIFKSSSC